MGGFADEKTFTNPPLNFSVAAAVQGTILVAVKRVCGLRCPAGVAKVGITFTV
jgi:hypothetical protein